MSYEIPFFLAYDIVSPLYVQKSFYKCLANFSNEKNVKGNIRKRAYISQKFN